MIIKGAARGNPTWLAGHLARTDTNEVAEQVELRGTVAQNALGALREMAATALCTKARDPLYHANIDPKADELMTPERWARAVELLEETLGFKDQPRLVVRHVKDGREHLHVVWSRIDVEEQRAIPDSHNYRKHEEVARQLEREFGHKRVQGALAERDGVPRPERTPSRAEMNQAERSGLDPAAIKAEVTALWQATDSGKALAAALHDAGYQLARGDKRDFVVIDQAGEVHSLARRVEGAKAKDVRERMADLDPATIPDVPQAKALQAERVTDRATAARAGNEPQQPAQGTNPDAADRDVDRAALLDAFLGRQSKASSAQAEAEPPKSQASPVWREQAAEVLEQRPEPATPEPQPPLGEADAPAADSVFTPEQREAEARALEQNQANALLQQQQQNAELEALRKQREELEAEDKERRRSDPRIRQEEDELAHWQAKRDERERKNLQRNHQKQWRDVENLERSRTHYDSLADDRLAMQRAEEDAAAARKNGGLFGWLKGLFNPSAAREREEEKQRIDARRQYDDARRLEERRERNAMERRLLTEAQERDKQQGEKSREARRKLELEDLRERQREREEREAQEALRELRGRSYDDDGRDFER